jgi:hypothetical protein
MHAYCAVYALLDKVGMPRIKLWSLHTRYSVL